MVWYNVVTCSGQIEQILFYFTETAFMLSRTIGSKQVQKKQCLLREGKMGGQMFLAVVTLAFRL